MLGSNLEKLHICEYRDQDVSSMVNYCPPHPVVVIIGDYRDPFQVFLVCEKKILCEISTNIFADAVLHFQHVLP